MVKFINSQTGSLMYVAEDRVQEYLALGHLPVGAPAAADEKPLTDAACEERRKPSSKKKKG